MLASSWSSIKNQCSKISILIHTWQKSSWTIGTSSAGHWLKSRLGAAEEVVVVIVVAVGAVGAVAILGLVYLVTNRRKLVVLEGTEGVPSDVTWRDVDVDAFGVVVISACN